MILGAWGMGRKRLPYDSEVEYLESTGTQHLLFDGESINGADIWVMPQSTTAAVNGSVGIWNNGSRGDSINFMTFQSRGFTVISAGGGGYNAQNIYTGLSREFRHVVINGLNVSVDGNAYTWNRGWRGGGIGTNKFALFGCYNTSSGKVDHQSCRIGPCRLYTGETVKLDLTPVRFTNELGQSEGAMYDRANPTAGMNPDGSPRNDGLYRNQGTGDFVLGPDK